MFKEKAHDITSKIRTEDVIISDDTNFKDLLLSPYTLKGLEISGFKKPSPIQKKAIPLGRCGFDLIVQAKSGTGKTCVFAVIALEMIQSQIDKLQVLILSPTREISFQIKEVILSIGQGFQKLKVNEFIGGTNLKNDKENLQKCQIAVGTPGRIKHLISENFMKLDFVRLFVLDEADRLMEDNFRKDISFIYLNLPNVKQMIAVSATFSPSLENFVTQFMNNPVSIKEGKEIFLLGIRQFVSIVPSHMSIIVQIQNKVTELIRILSFIRFKQCLVFSNYQSRAESICNLLNKVGWPAVHINGSQEQKIRLKTLSSLKDFRFRILLSTDLTSRGIDVENINLVVNLDLPYDSVTYMHRMGRAGRYGTSGLTLTIVQEGPELIKFQKMLTEIGGKDFSVSLFPEGNINFDIWKVKKDNFKQIFSFNEDNKCEDEEELIRKQEVDQNVLEENEDVEFERKLKLFQSCSKKKINLKSYSQLLELMEDYKKKSKKIEINSTNKNISTEMIPLKVLSWISCLEQTAWKNFKKKVEKVDVLPEIKINCEQVKISVKKNEDKTGNNHKKISNYSYDEYENKKINGRYNAKENEEVRDEEKNENFQNLNNYHLNGNEREDGIGKSDCENGVNDECEEELVQKIGTENIQRFNKSYFYSSEKKNINANGTIDTFESEKKLDEETESTESEESDYKEDAFHPNSRFFEDWYSLYNSQMSTVRQYINYAKQFYYYKEILNQLR